MNRISLREKLSKAHWVWGMVLATLLLGCGKSPEELLASARTLHAKGELNGAVLELKSLLQDDPDHGESRLYLGSLYSEMGDYRSAEKELRRAREAGIATERVLPLLTKALVLQGEPRRALETSSLEGIQDPAAAAQVKAMHGLAHLALGESGKAEAAFQESLRLDPHNVDALLGRGRLLAAEKRFDEALKEVDIALGKQQRAADVLMLRGDLLRALAQVDEAKEAYEKVVEIQPSHVNALLALVAMDLSAGALDAASGRLDAARKAAPANPMVRYFEALMQFRKGDFRRARDSIGNVLKVAPSHLPSVLVGGAVEFALGSHELAQTRLKHVLERAPANIYARRLLIASYARTGQTHKAMELLSPMLKQGTNDASVLALAGELHMQLGEYEQARAYFEQATALAPKSSAMRTGLGLSRLAVGDVDLATAELQSAAALDNDKHHADVLLIATHLQHRQYAQALTAAQALARKQPDSPTTYNLMAAAQIGIKDIASARRSLEKALFLRPTYTPAAVNLANLDVEAGDKVAARKRLEDVIARDRSHVPAYIALVSLAPRLGATQKEIEGWLEAARREAPGSAQPLVMLARFYFQAGEPKKALELMEKALVDSPNNVEVLELAGQVQLRAGEKYRAIGTFGRWVSAQPTSASAHYRMATAQISNGDLAGAIKSLHTALLHRPRFPEAQVLLAQAEADNGGADRALKVATDLQQQNPKSSLGWLVQGDILTKIHRHGSAVEAYERAFSLHRSGATVMKLHAALTKSGRVGEGEKRIQEWLGSNSGDDSTRAYLAESYLKERKHKRAIEQYELLLERYPDDPVVLNNLAWCYQQVNDDRAMQTAEKALRLQPDNAAIMDTLGSIMLEGGDIARGVALLSRASGLSPRVPEIRYHYVQALAKSGEKRRAKDELERLLVEFPKFANEETMKLLAALRAN